MKAFEHASWLLVQEIEEARQTHNRNHIRRLRRLWQYNAFGAGSKHGEKWASILKKFDSEGSTWIVWWQDGVKRYIERYLKS